MGKTFFVEDHVGKESEDHIRTVPKKGLYGERAGTSWWLCTSMQSFMWVKQRESQVWACVIQYRYFSGL